MSESDSIDRFLALEYDCNACSGVSGGDGRASNEGRRRNIFQVEIGAIIRTVLFLQLKDFLEWI